MTPLSLLRRHLVLDPGTLDRHDQKVNRDALKDGSRIFSSYLVGPTDPETGDVSKGEKVWVITEADRSSTCILLPDEY